MVIVRSVLRALVARPVFGRNVSEYLKTLIRRCVITKTNDSSVVAFSFRLIRDTIVTLNLFMHFAHNLDLTNLTYTLIL